MVEPRLVDGTDRIGAEHAVHIDAAHLDAERAGEAGVAWHSDYAYETEWAGASRRMMR
jgi:hypothetical protein